MLTVHLRGGHAGPYLYRIIQDHYRTEDIYLGKTDEYQ